VDGSDVSEEWGLENLKLEGITDLDWVEWKNNMIYSHMNVEMVLCGVASAAASLRSV